MTKSPNDGFFERSVTLTLDGRTILDEVEMINIVLVVLLTLMSVLFFIRVLTKRRNLLKPNEKNPKVELDLMESFGLLSLPLPLAYLLVCLWAVLLVVLVFGIFWVLVGLFLRGPEGADASEMGADLRWYLLTLTALIAACGAVIALPFTILRTRFSARQVVATEQGLITDRINKAVEALGAEKVRKTEYRYIEYSEADDAQPVRVRVSHSQANRIPKKNIVKREDWQTIEDTVPNLEVRVGAIYALERISQDSERDRFQIMEILTAYVRQNSPLRQSHSAVDGSGKAFVDRWGNPP